MVRAAPASRQLLAPRPAFATVRMCSSSSKTREWLDEKAKADKDGADGEASEKKDGGSSEEPPLPLHQRLVSDLGALFGFVKSKVGSAGDAAANAANAARAASGSGGEGDPNAGSAVAVRKQSFWEKFSNTESPFFERIRNLGSKAGEASGRFGDIFSETEEGEARAMLKEALPTFQQEEFLEHVGEELGPLVIGAYLKGDLDILRAHTRDQAFAILNSSVQERITRQVRVRSVLCVCAVLCARAWWAVARAEGHDHLDALTSSRSHALTSSSSSLTLTSHVCTCACVRGRFAWTSASSISPSPSSSPSRSSTASRRSSSPSRLISSSAPATRRIH